MKSSLLILSALVLSTNVFAETQKENYTLFPDPCEYVDEQWECGEHKFYVQEVSDGLQVVMYTDNRDNNGFVDKAASISSQPTCVEKLFVKIQAEKEDRVILWDRATIVVNGRSLPLRTLDNKTYKTATQPNTIVKAGSHLIQAVDADTQTCITDLYNAHTDIKTYIPYLEGDVEREAFWSIAVRGRSMSEREAISRTGIPLHKETYYTPEFGDPGSMATQGAVAFAVVATTASIPFAFVGSFIAAMVGTAVVMSMPGYSVESDSTLWAVGVPLITAVVLIPLVYLTTTQIGAYVGSRIDKAAVVEFNENEREKSVQSLKDNEYSRAKLTSFLDILNDPGE